MHITVRHTLALAALGCALSAQAAPVVVFATDFEAGVPAAISPGAALAEGVQGYAGLGVKGSKFGGSMLRSPTGNVVTLTLTGLPKHKFLNLDFLFAAIDSLDGTGSYPAGDFFNVSVDGTSIFRESFANAHPSQIQSYVPSPGLELARLVDLGFSGPGGFFTDSAYALGREAVFKNIPHTASSAVITFVVEGPGIQPIEDESWGIDNLQVTTSRKAK